MKRVIPRRRESGDLYILETQVSTPIACSGIVTLGSPFSLFVEKDISSVFEPIILEL